jgi:hypothetical protein
MSDLPANTSTLVQTFEQARDRARHREVEAVERLLADARVIIYEEIPAGPHRQRLLFGCDRAEELVADEPLVAAEYLRALRDQADDGR